jgi:endoglucanase
MTRRGARRLTGAFLIVMAVVGGLAAIAAGAHRPTSRAIDAAGCPEPSALRDASNPLMLPTPPGANPLNGALPYLFVDGPAHGPAAGAIATLLGRDPHRYLDAYSWASFAKSLGRGGPHRKLKRNPGLARKVRLLEKIAVEPEANRFSLYSAGGGPGAIGAQVRKIFCGNLRADPGSIPIITTYFLYQQGYCESAQQIVASRPRFQRQVNEMVAGIGTRRAILLLEFDAVGASRCMQSTGALPQWEADIRYEVDAAAALHHAVVYVEGGYADGNSPQYTAQVLNTVDIGRIRGFFTNDTHNDWTINEVRWAQRVAGLTHGAHFIVNTATNGHGPLVPSNRVKYGNEVLCNPPGRGLGPEPSTDTGFAGADAFLWTAVPGNSSGRCNGGPPSGVFWTARALALSALANGRLGPGYPSRPY